MMLFLYPREMRKIILDLAVTLDGFIEGPNGEIDWCSMEGDNQTNDIFEAFLADIDTIFYGRVSYDLWGNYEPAATDSPALKRLFQSIHSKIKYVFSTTGTDTSGGAIFINSNIRERVEEIKGQAGKNIWLYGGAKLISTFINLGLVDVYRLAVHPVILGSGKPLFSDIKQRTELQLVNCQTSSSGVAFLIYSSR